VSRVITLKAVVGVLVLASPALAQPQLLVTDALTLINSGDSIDLGDVRVGELTGKLLTLRSAGDEPLQFGQPPVVFGGNPTGTIGIIGATSAPANLGNIQPGGLGVLPLGLQVLTAGQVSLDVIVQSNDPDNPQYKLVLQANGIQPVMAMSVDGTDVDSGDTVDLGDIEVGQEIQVDLLVQNTGDATLNVQKVVMDLSGDGGASLTNTVPLAIEEAQSSAIPVTYTSIQEGEQVTQLSLLNDSDQNPYVVLLRANGLPAGQNGPCGFGTAPVLPMTLLGLVALRFCAAGQPRRR
jgi:hypothetical protein